MEKIIYHYNDNKVFIGQSKARQNPLDKDKFLIPAKTTTTKPPVCLETEEIYYEDGWKKRLKKLKAPSKHHKWSDKKGWELSKNDQVKLDTDIIKEKKEKENLDLLSTNEVKIYAEMRRIAVENLKTKGELTKDFIG